MGKKGKEVDGFMALKAAQRAAQEMRAARGAPPVQDPTKKPTQSSVKPTANSHNIAIHARKTVMPTTYEVVCYECGFSFSQTGRSKSTSCPKCRAILDFVDHKINGIWNDSIKTAGKVIVHSDGTVTGGSIFASDVVLKGRITGGITKAYQWLEVHEKGEFDPTCVTAKDLKLKKGASLKTKQATYRHVEIAGTLEADLKASGLVHIKAGGSFTGKITGDRLQVDEGGGLCADLEINATPEDP